jgi:hypothetical protein
MSINYYLHFSLDYLLPSAKTKGQAHAKMVANYSGLFKGFVVFKCIGHFENKFWMKVLFVCLRHTDTE